MSKLRTILLAALTCAAAVTFSPAAKAQATDMSGRPQTTNAWGPGWMVRLRAIGVLPDADGDNILLDGAPLASADIDIDDSIVPELDISYFFTSHLAMELILAVSPHDIEGEGVLQGALGDTWLLPPTLLAQYHFNPGGRLKPYVGAGVNYTVMFNSDASESTLPNAGLTVSGLSVDDEWGWALQAGVDIQLFDNVYLNVDVKKLWLDTEATVTTAQGSIVTADVDIDPVFVGAGIGFKFGTGRGY